MHGARVSLRAARVRALLSLETIRSVYTISACRIAVATAWVRVSASSLVIALRTWDWIVSAEIPSSVAAFSFVIPLERSVSICRSRFVRAGSGAAVAAVGERTGQPGVDVRSSGGNGGEGDEQLGERRLLEDEAASAGLERLSKQRLVMVPRVHDDARLRRADGGLAGDLDAVERLHRDVHERGHGPVRHDLAHRVVGS